MIKAILANLGQYISITKYYTINQYRYMILKVFKSKYIGNN